MLIEEFGRITDLEVEEAILNGKIIENYPEDKPDESALVFGLTKRARPIHMVCALDLANSLTIIVTVYEPDPNFWLDFKYRKKQ